MLFMKGHFMQKLKNKKALITGAARGIGRAIAARFIEEGAEVILTDIDKNTLQQTGVELGVASSLLDVSQESHWLELSNNHPHIDIMVNNAGITGFEKGINPHDPEHASLRDWHEVHAVNLDGTFLGCRYAIGAMKDKGAGSIINISSRSGMVGIAGAAAYASSKAAIRNHSKSVALYCAQQGWKIRCNSIHPAAIMTPMWDSMLPRGEGREEAIDGFVKDTPLRRFGEATEVAALASMLANDESSYITGAEFTIDGGLLAGSAATPG